jgi:hypothetical protein
MRGEGHSTTRAALALHASPKLGEAALHTHLNSVQIGLQPCKDVPSAAEYMRSWIVDMGVHAHDPESRHAAKCGRHSLVHIALEAKVEYAAHILPRAVPQYIFVW